MKKIIQSINLFLIVVLIAACSGDLDPKDYPAGIMGMWVAKHIGNEIIIYVESKKTLQIQYSENNLSFVTNYYFQDEKTLVFEKPKQANVIKKLSKKELEFEKTETRDPIPFLKGLVFKKVED